MSVSRSTVIRGSRSAPTHTRYAALAIAAALSANAAFAADGTWTTATAGTYTYADPANWLGGVVADGAGALANFGAVDVNGIVVSNLAEPHTLGRLTFGDTDVSTPGGYQLTGGIITLDNTGGPGGVTITNNGMAIGSTARIDNVLTGGAASPVTFTGPGTIHLTAANTFTGGAILTNANLLIGTGSTQQPNVFGPVTVGVASTNLTLNGTNTIGSGTSASGTAFIGNNIIANAGSVTTFNMGRRFAIGQNGTTSVRSVTGTGSLIFNLASQESRNDFLANFNAFAGNVTFTAQQYTTASGTFSPVARLLVNGGNFGAGFTAANVAVNDFAVLSVITNSGGNTVSFGALSGNSNQAGFLSGTAGAITFSVGALNTNTTFAGLFLGTSKLTKVGTGSLTLTSPQSNTGVTVIDNGKLALSGPGRLDASTSIQLTVAASQFDVSSTDAPYSTAANQTLLGRGTVLGNYTHDEGTLTPGALQSAGTLTFANNLSLTGGTINFDTSVNLTPGSTNDLINVGGVLDLSGAVTLNLAGVLNTGTYTLANAAGGVTGSTAGWTVVGGARGAGLALGRTSTTLTLTVTPGTPASLVYVSGPFDIGTSVSFKNGATPDRFFQGDAVRFDDTATNFAVVYEQALLPSSLVVDNTVNNYTFSSTTGNGLIGGTGSLTKRGSGSLTITTNNTYTGGTLVEAGTLDTGTQANAIGTGALTLGLNAASTTLFRNSSPTGANATIANNIVVRGNATLELDNGSSTASPPVTTSRQTILTGTLSGPGTLNLTTVQPAGAALVIKGVDISGDTRGLTGTFNLGTNISMRWQNATASGSPTAAFDVASGATMGSILATATTIPLGSLSGAGTLRGHSSSGNGGTITYEIGALNTSTTFDGVVVDGAQAATVKPVLITKVGTGTLTFNGANTYTGVTTVQAGTLVLSASSTGPVLGSATVTTPGGADIQGGKLVLGYVPGASPAATIRTILAAGFVEPTPFQTGQIRSTTLSGNRRLGYRDNADAAQVEVAYTLPGDADLSFAVDFNDLLALAQNYNPSGTGKVWSQGDFDYNDVVDFNDLLALAQNYNQSLSVAQQAILGSGFSGDYALALSLVPEPATLGLLGGVATLLIGRRRRA